MTEAPAQQSTGFRRLHPLTPLLRGWKVFAAAVAIAAQQLYGDVEASWLAVGVAASIPVGHRLRLPLLAVHALPDRRRGPAARDGSPVPAVAAGPARPAAGGGRRTPAHRARPRARRAAPRGRRRIVVRGAAGLPLRAGRPGTARRAARAGGRPEPRHAGGTRGGPADRAGGSADQVATAHGRRDRHRRPRARPARPDRRSAGDLAAGPSPCRWRSASARPLFGPIIRHFDFTVADSPDGLRLRHGLLETRAQTVPPGRVQAVRIIEPLLWRSTRLVPGRGQHRGLRRRRAEPGLRAASRGAARGGLRHAAPGDARRGRLDGGDARRTAVARWVDPFAWRFKAAGADERVFVARRGRLRRETDIVPHERVQSARLTQGPLQRRLGLAIDPPGHDARARCSRQRHTAGRPRRGDLLDAEVGAGPAGRGCSAPPERWMSLPEPPAAPYGGRVSAALELTDPAFVDDPYPVFAQLRRAVAAALARADDAVAALTYALSNAVLRDRRIGRLWRDKQPAKPLRAVQPAAPPPDDGERAARPHPAAVAGHQGVRARAHRAAAAAGAADRRRPAGPGDEPRRVRPDRRLRRAAAGGRSSPSCSVCPRPTTTCSGRGRRRS